MKPKESENIWKVRTHDVLFKYLQTHGKDKGWKTWENNKVK